MLLIGRDFLVAVDTDKTEVLNVAFATELTNKASQTSVLSGRVSSTGFKGRIT